MNIPLISKPLFYAVLAATVFGSHVAQSQYALPSVQAAQFTAEQMLQSLLPKPSETRGIDRAQPGGPTAAEAPKATLVVTFEEGTDRLTVDGMRTLQALAYAMQDLRLQNAQFQIAAHGYAQGDPQLQVRTARRAQTVAEHLAGFYDIDFHRMFPMGLGAQYPANPTNPMDPLNNRIEVINMSAN